MAIKTHDVIIKRENWSFDDPWYRTEILTGSDKPVVASLRDADGCWPIILLAKGANVQGGKGIKFAMRAESFDGAVGIVYAQEA